MGKGSREDGAMVRRAILAELVRRWENMEPEPTWQQLSDLLSTSMTNVRYHTGILRKLLYVHPDGLVCTPLGYREIRGKEGLTT